MLSIGSKAPDFRLPDKDGRLHSLSNYRGKKIVLYFYPKDATPGCSRQAMGFAALHDAFLAKNALVIGISKDSVLSHKKFAEKYALPFVLLSDTELSAISAYGVWQEKQLAGRRYMGVVRSAFLIDENGILQQVFYNVKAADNPQKMLEVLA